MLLLRCTVALLALLGALLLPNGLPNGPAPRTAHADVVGGAATTYTLTEAAGPNARLFVPWFAFDWEGWSSTLAIENAATIPTTVTLSARELGSTGPDSTASVTVPPRGQVIVNGNDIGLRPGFVGVLQLSGGPLAAVADHHAVGRNRVSLPALPAEPDAAAAELPLLFRDYRGWNSTLVVVNTSDLPNEVEVVLRPMRRAGDPPPAAQWRSVLRLTPGGAERVPLEAAPAGATLAASIRSASGRPIQAVTLNQGPGGAASASVGFARGAPTLYLSLLYRELNGYNSDILVQNVGSAPATPEVRLIGSEGPPRRLVAERSVPPGAAYVFRLANQRDLPPRFSGAGIVGSAEGEPLIALAQHLNPAAATAMQTPASPAGAAGALQAALLYGNYAGYTSGLLIANVDSAPATVTVTFYDTFGNRLLDTEPVSVAPNRTLNVYVPGVLGLGPEFIGSAAVGSIDGRRVVAAATHLRPASADTSLAIVRGLPFNRLDAAGTAVYFSDGVPSERVQGSIDGLAAARRAIPTMLEVPPPEQTLELFLFPSSNAYRRGRALLTDTPLQQVPTFSEGAFVPLGSRIAILEDVGGPYRTPGSVALLIAHEYAHQVIDAATRGRPIPPWLSEGLANWAAYDLISTRYPADAARQWRSWQGVVASALALDAAVPLTDLATYPQWADLGNNGRDDLIYGEAVLAVDYLIQQHGLPTVARMLKRIGNGGMFNPTFVAVTGGSVAEFGTALTGYLNAALPVALPRGLSALPETGTPGTTFSFNAIAWKPRQPVTVTVTRPNGTQLTFNVTTSAVGFLDWAFATSQRSQLGRWTVSFEGEQGDRGEVRFTLVAPPGEATGTSLAPAEPAGTDRALPAPSTAGGGELASDERIAARGAADAGRQAAEVPARPVGATPGPEPGPTPGLDSVLIRLLERLLPHPEDLRRAAAAWLGA